MPRTGLGFPTVLLFLALLFFGIGETAATPSGTSGSKTNNLRLLRLPCKDDSFPLAAPEETDHRRQRQRLLVAIPTDESGRSYAPLCLDDDRRIDMRRIRNCPVDQCWATSYQSCMDRTSSACFRSKQNGSKNNNDDIDVVANGEMSKKDENKVDFHRKLGFSPKKATRRVQSQCGGGQCWVEMLQLCLNISSQECRNDPPTKKPTGAPTPSPTPVPTFATEETQHSVKLTLENVPLGYELTADIRALIIRFVTETVEKWLDEPMKLVEVKFGGNLGRRQRRLLSSSKTQQRTRRRLDDVPVPLEVTLSGPSNMSDFALIAVMEILQERIQDLVGTLKSYDKETFKDVDVGASTYNPNDIVESEIPTRKPTKRPTKMPTSEYPTLNTMEITIHPVQLIFRSAPAGYTFSAEDRASLIRFVSEILEEGLDKRLQLLEVSYAGILLQSSAVRSDRLLRSSGPFSPQLALLIKVRGPSDISDFALSYIIEVIRENMLDLEYLLRSLDFDVFAKPNPSIETYNLYEISDTSQMETTVHPIELIFESVPAGYVLSPEARESLVNFISGILEEGLGDRFEFLEAVDAGMLRRAKTRLLESGSPSLPILVSVRGPSDISGSALPYIMQVIRDNMQALEDFLESLDESVFEKPNVLVVPYVIGESPGDVEIMKEEEEGTPWWVWLLVALGVLTLLGCICLCCSYYYNHKYKKRKEKSSVKEIIIERPIVEDRIIANPIIVEKPVIVEKPIIVERQIQVREHDKKTKKHHKRKKRKSKKSIPAQIEQQSTFGYPAIAGPDGYGNGMPKLMNGGFSFRSDPQSEAYLQIEGEDAYHGRLLAPTTVASMSVSPAGAKEMKQKSVATKSVASSYSKKMKQKSVATMSAASSYSKKYLQIQGEDPNHGSLLAPTTIATMSVSPAHAKEMKQKSVATTSVASSYSKGMKWNRHDPSTYNRGFSADDPSQHSQPMSVATMSAASSYSKGMKRNSRDPSMYNRGFSANDPSQQMSFPTMSPTSSYSKGMKRNRRDPSMYSRGFSANNPPQGGVLTMMKGRGSESGSSYSSYSRRHGQDASGIHSYFQKEQQSFRTESPSQYMADEPSGIYRNANRSQYTEDRSHPYSAASQPQYGYSKEPSSSWSETKSHATWT